MRDFQEPGAGAAPPPRHVAIIMDGNGRWAAARGLPRMEGHRRGVESVRAAVKHAGERGIGCLTLFAFSSENWSRPEAEVRGLMGLLKRYIRQDLADLHRNGVRVRVIGSRELKDSEIAGLIEECETLTAGNTRLTLAVAFNYGAQDEIVRAARRLAGKVAEGTMGAEDITVDSFAAHLDTADLPPLDLLIRTSGEQRLSNFLLWQCAYAEFVFTDVLWPDFNGRIFDDALAEFTRRERRYGGLGAGAPEHGQAVR